MNDQVNPPHYHLSYKQIEGYTRYCERVIITIMHYGGCFFANPKRIKAHVKNY